LALTTEGLLLDDTYMAKTMTLFRQLASGEPSPVVFWHTGGIAAALAALIRDPGASSTGPTSTLPHTQPTPVVHESPTPTERVHE
jgi:hypothetical protein